MLVFYVCCIWLGSWKTKLNLKWNSKAKRDKGIDKKKKKRIKAPTRLKAHQTGPSPLLPDPAGPCYNWQRH
jgi:hypothetical protein